MTTSFDASKRCVVLEVRDEGVGIPPEHLARLCDPFSPPSRKRRDRAWSGHHLFSRPLARWPTHFDSEPGKGTRARVTFPCHSEEKSSLLNLSPAGEE